MTQKESFIAYIYTYVHAYTHAYMDINATD